MWCYLLGNRWLVARGDRQTDSAGGISRCISGKAKKTCGSYHGSSHGSTTNRPDSSRASTVRRLYK